MRKIIVSGKPSGWQDAPDSGEDVVYGGMFTLTEWYFDGESRRKVEHSVYVPTKRCAFVKAQVEKGYTVVVESEITFTPVVTVPGHAPEGFLMAMRELHTL